MAYNEAKSQICKFMLTDTLSIIVIINNCYSKCFQIYPNDINNVQMFVSYSRKWHRKK